MALAWIRRNRPFHNYHRGYEGWQRRCRYLRCSHSEAALAWPGSLLKRGQEHSEAAKGHRQHVQTLSAKVAWTEAGRVSRYLALLSHLRDLPTPRLCNLASAL